MKKKLSKILLSKAAGGRVWMYTSGCTHLEFLTPPCRRKSTRIRRSRADLQLLLISKIVSPGSLPFLGALTQLPLGIYWLQKLSQKSILFLWLRVTKSAKCRANGSSVSAPTRMSSTSKFLMPHWLLHDGNTDGTVKNQQWGELHKT